MRKADGISAEDLIRAAKIVFAKFGLPKKTVLDKGMNFVSDWFKQFYRQLNIDQAISSPYHHQINGQVEACTAFGKHTIQTFFDDKNDISLAILQIRSTSIGVRLPNPATLLLNGWIKALSPQMNREPFNINADNRQYEALKVHQDTYIKGNDTFFSYRVYSSHTVRRWWTVDT